MDEATRERQILDEVYRRLNQQAVLQQNAATIFAALLEAKARDPHAVQAIADIRATGFFEDMF
jgi:hypothetical protein